MARIFDLSHRFKLKLTGPQALWFLDQLITNQVVELPPGAGALALLLTPKGKITAQLRVLSTDDGVLVDLDADDPESVLSFFNMRIFATKVQIADVTGDFALLRVIGPDAGSVVASALGATLPPEVDNSLVPFEQGLVVRLAAPLEGLDLWVPASAKAYISMTLAQSGVQTGSQDEYEAYRVMRGVPVLGVDFDSTFLPQEAAYERGVHFKKGCYLGQEAVAMTQRGKVKRRLRHLEFDGPAVQGELFYMGSPAGMVTSVAGQFGIATVRTTVEVDAGVQVRTGGTVATALVKVLPATVEGPSVPSARELRERLGL